MKIQLISDLHLGFKHKTLPRISAEADILVLAGDISASVLNLEDYFGRVREVSDMPIIMCLGNHDYYGHYLNKAAEDLAVVEDRFDDVHILSREWVEIDGVNFVGTTLWTDFDKRRDEVAVATSFPDYYQIYSVSDEYAPVNITSADILKEHARDKAWLADIVRPEEKTVVLTHHVPLTTGIPEMYRGNPKNGGFYVDMSEFILDYKPDVWCCGHTHYFRFDTVGSCGVYCNPWGYPFEAHIVGHYKEEFLIEV